MRDSVNKHLIIKMNKQVYSVCVCTSTHVQYVYTIHSVNINILHRVMCVHVYVKALILKLFIVTGE